MTLGEKRVVLDYTCLTEEQKAKVVEVKRLFADMIDIIDEEGYTDRRLSAIVQSKLEDTCIYYTKLIISK